MQTVYTREVGIIRNNTIKQEIELNQKKNKSRT